MIEGSKDKPNELPLPKRIIEFAINSGLLVAISWFVLHEWHPASGGRLLWMTGGVGLFLFFTLSAPFFVRPRIALASAIAAGLGLLTLDLSKLSPVKAEFELARNAALILDGTIILCSLVAIFTHGTPKTASSGRRSLQRVSYLLSFNLGRGHLIFMPPIIISILAFYQGEPREQMWLLLGVMLLLAMNPGRVLVQLYADLTALKGDEQGKAALGEIRRIDDPDLVRVALTSTRDWRADQVLRACLADGRHMELLPLFHQVQDQELIGTGLLHQAIPEPDDSLEVARVYPYPDARPASDLLRELSGGRADSKLAGIVVENSTIHSLRFEVSSNEPLEAGMVVSVFERQGTVYFQILDARTSEESFSENPRGTHIVTASQLGSLDGERGFVSYKWVPKMNAPVFIPTVPIVAETLAPKNTDEFILGSIPATTVPVRAGLSDLFIYHTAILGVTGMGKTELVFDLIRAHVEAGRKIFCVDFTGEYMPRLSDLDPKRIGFSETDSLELEKLVNEIEYGAYKSEAEKKKLDEWLREKVTDIQGAVATFLMAADQKVGVFELDEIANTRASLRATELYMTAIFEWARKNRKAQEILIVIEEAHTVIPESTFLGFDKGETHAVVGRMGQIALQGRKYGVGLLLVSQRTALVSKTLLSQCNTCIVFALHDETGLNYLKSVFPTEHITAIPNLRPLQAIAFGKGVKSERPILFEIPEDPKKRKESAKLDKPTDGTDDRPTRCD